MSTKNKFNFETISNSFFVDQTKDYIVEDNPDVKTSDLYELFSQLFLSHTWNVASKKNINFYEILQKIVLSENKEKVNKLSQKLIKVDKKQIIYKPGYENTISQINSMSLNNKIDPKKDLYNYIFLGIYEKVTKDFRSLTSISTIEGLNAYIGGGIHRGSLTNIMSLTGGGKTTLFIKTGASALLDKFEDQKKQLKVLHFIGDNSVKYIVENYLYALGNIPLERKNKPTASDQKKILETAKKYEEILKNNLTLVLHEDKMHSINILEEIKENFTKKTYDLILIDDLNFYIDHLNQSSYKQGPEIVSVSQQASVLKNITIALKTIACEHNCAIILGKTQIQKFSSTGSYVPMAGNETCDLILNLSKLDKDETKINITKNRWGPANIVLDIALLK